jgi:uncharacterized membrane protein
MNWKRIIIAALVIAAVFMLIAFTGGIDNQMNLIAIATPLIVFLILVVLVINTYYQSEILKTLKSFGNQDDVEDEQ